MPFISQIPSWHSLSPHALITNLYKYENIIFFIKRYKGIDSKIQNYNVKKKKKEKKRQKPDICSDRFKLRSKNEVNGSCL